jgi:hypothetical protein
MMLAAMPNTIRSAGHGGAFETSPERKNGEVSNLAAAAHSPLKSVDCQDWHGSCHLTRARSGVAAFLHVTGRGEAECQPTPQRRADFREAKAARGGARNHANRVSHALTKAQTANLGAAERHAARIGLPFTRMLTIHWEAAGMPLAGMAKATGRFIDLLTRWLARNGHRTAWLWVHENGPRKGGHCHMLAHVPAGCVKDLTGKSKRWLRAITGSPYRARVILSKPIGGRLGLEAGNPELHAINLAAALAYVCKGASPEAASQFGLERLESGGRVIGKRCGTSQNIGAKARKAKD